MPSEVFLSPCVNHTKRVSAQCINAEALMRIYILVCTKIRSFVFLIEAVLMAENTIDQKLLNTVATQNANKDFFKLAS